MGQHPLRRILLLECLQKEVRNLDGSELLLEGGHHHNVRRASGTSGCGLDLGLGRQRTHWHWVERRMKRYLRRIHGVRLGYIGYERVRRRVRGRTEVAVSI